MAEDQSNEKSSKASLNDLLSKHHSRQESAAGERVDEVSEVPPNGGAEASGPEGRVTTSPKDGPTEDLSNQASAGAHPEGPPNPERTKGKIASVPLGERSEPGRASKPIPLGRATIKGLTEELVRMEEALKESAESTVEARRELYIARERSRALSKYMKILAIVSILLMLCVIGQIFLVEYLMRPGN